MLDLLFSPTVKLELKRASDSLLAKRCPVMAMGLCWFGLEALDHGPKKFVMGQVLAFKGFSRARCLGPPFSGYHDCVRPCFFLSLNRLMSCLCLCEILRNMLM